jgi:hypothetical protein
MALGLPDFGLCAAFSDTCMTNPSTRSAGRRRRNAKVRHRDQDGPVWPLCGMALKRLKAISDESSAISGQADMMWISADRRC